MKKEDYLSILQKNVTPSLEKIGLGGNCVFQQYDDPKHSSKIVKKWLLYRMPKLLDHPPQFPDLNPIEHLWAYVDKKAIELNISCKDDINAALQDVWTKIPPVFKKKRLESMPNRSRSCDKILKTTNRIFKTIFCTT